MRKLLSLVLLLGLQGTPPSAKAQSPSAVLQPLAFLSGHWTSVSDGDTQEEYWSPPIQNSMVGSFRVVRAANAFFYEFWVVEVEEGNAVFKMKHFNRGLHGWEDKDDMVRLVLAVRGKQDVVFSNQDSSLSLRYRRKDNELTSTLRRVKDGKANEDVFHFHWNE